MQKTILLLFSLSLLFFLQSASHDWVDGAPGSIQTRETRPPVSGVTAKNFCCRLFRFEYQVVITALPAGCALTWKTFAILHWSSLLIFVIAPCWANSCINTVISYINLTIRLRPSPTSSVYRSSESSQGCQVSTKRHVKSWLEYVLQS